jgi:hypothetical protein
MESFEMVDGVTNLDKLSASALFFPGLYAISKSKAPKAANHLCPVASKFAVAFELHTDASGIGLGAVLYQNQGGLNRPLTFASRD